MKLIVGLGNPEEQHAYNRHNVGWMLVDELANKYKDSLIKKSHSILSIILEFEINNEKVLLVKPSTYMNNSGESVSTLSRFYKIKASDILIIHDDLDLKLGEYKLQFGKGPKVHNGVDSVENHLKSKDFWRLRIGVDARDSENRIQGEKYVLEDFSLKEQDLLRETFSRVVKEISLKFIDL